MTGVEDLAGAAAEVIAAAAFDVEIGMTDVGFAAAVAAGMAMEVDAADVAVLDAAAGAAGGALPYPAGGPLKITCGDGDAMAAATDARTRTTALENSMFWGWYCDVGGSPLDK
ncbi:hypothetical protein HK101_007643 [Irineochytrium annulatum]|nr:hypothetical protein HK101_007643 [Irineochytrium annulatum]